MDKDDGGREWEVVMFSLSEPRGMVAKDCMESNKGAAGSGIKNEMASRDAWLNTGQKGESPDWK